MQNCKMFSRVVTGYDIREEGEIKKFIDHVMFNRPYMQYSKSVFDKEMISLAESLSYKMPYELFYLIFTPQKGVGPIPLRWEYSCLVALLNCYAIENALSLLSETKRDEFIEKYFHSEDSQGLYLLKPYDRVEKILDDIDNIQKVPATAQKSSEISFLRWLLSEINNHEPNKDSLRFIDEYVKKRALVYDNKLTPILNNLVRLLRKPRNLNNISETPLSHLKMEFNHAYKEFLKCPYGKHAVLNRHSKNETPEVYFQKLFSILSKINYYHFNKKKIKLESKNTVSENISDPKAVDSVTLMAQIMKRKDTGRTTLQEYFPNSRLINIMQHCRITQLPLSDTEFLQIPENLPHHWTDNLSANQIFKLLFELDKHFDFNIEDNLQDLAEMVLDEILLHAIDEDKRPTSPKEAFALLGVEDSATQKMIIAKWSEIESAYLSMSKPTMKDIYAFELKYAALRLLTKEKIIDINASRLAEQEALKIKTLEQLTCAKLEKRIDLFVKKNTYHAKKLFDFSAINLGTVKRYERVINDVFLEQFLEIKLNPTLFDQVKQELATKLNEYMTLVGDDVGKLHRYFASEVIALVDDKRFKSVDLRAVILGICGFFLTLFSIGFAHLHPGFRATFFSSKERYQVYNLSKKLDDTVRSISLAV